MLSQIVEIIAVLALLSIVTEVWQLDLTERGVHFFTTVRTIKIVQPRKRTVDVINTYSALAVIQQCISVSNKFFILPLQTLCVGL